MGVTTLTLPRLGETMEEARVTDWLKAPGEAFRRGDVLLEVETDKTVVEVPALTDGTLITHLVAPGEMVALDQPIAEVEVAGSAAPPPRRDAPGSGAMPMAAHGQPATAPDDRAIAEVTVAGSTPGASGQDAPVSGGAPKAPPPEPRPAASPLARRLARAAGVPLETLTGSGRRGRIMAADIPTARTGGFVPTRFGPIAMRQLPGTRTPILLLHGLHDEGKGWRDLPDRLARAGHAVLVPDLPGHGASGASTTDMADMIDALMETLAQTLSQGPIRLVGHSLGAILATRLAARLGTRAEHLLLLAPAGLGPRINADFLDLMGNADTPDALNRAMRMLGAGPVSDTVLRQELARLQRQRPATNALAQSLARNGIQQVDIAPDLARLTAPITAVFGLADAIVDWRDCANLPARAAIHLVPDAGHLPHAAAPDLIATLITGAGLSHAGGSPQVAA